MVIVNNVNKVFLSNKVNWEELVGLFNLKDGELIKVEI